MNLPDFDYDLPADRIAQAPPERRDAARLLWLDRRTGALDETPFSDLASRLGPEDLLVLNDTRVLPARLRATKPTGGRVTILLLPGTGGMALLSTSRGLRRGTRLDLGGGAAATLVDDPREGRARLAFPGSDEASVLAARGVMPLPPYIHRDPGDVRDPIDRERYQTVYAAQEGAVAAPTAGLHFTPALLAAIEARGIGTARLTLHVGPGTFLPVRTPDIARHRVEAEWCRVPEATALAVQRCRARGGRVVAVGTTVTRALEWRARDDRTIAPGEGACDLYLRPGHHFRVVDALVTNLHLPKSSLLILVAAFAGLEPILSAYREAIRRGFHFYSYGDAMCIA
jgi:S-adenosylmethionine:tRNA ribosyltransferase-isomerase